MKLDIIEAFEKYGIEGIIGFLILTVIISVIKSKWFGKLVDRIIDFTHNKILKYRTKSMRDLTKVSFSDVSNHHIFNEIDSLINNDVPTLQFSTDYRTVVFKKYITVYLKTYKKNLRKFVRDKEYEKMDKAELSASFFSLINNTIYDYEKEAKANGIPDIIIIKMKSENTDKISLTLNLIQSLVSTNFYESKNNLLKLYSLLGILYPIIEHNVMTAEKVCNSINGALKGLEFEGKIEP